jgi:hypothetical protein
MLASKEPNRFHRSPWAEVGRAGPAVHKLCDTRPYYARTLTWCKVALLAELTVLVPRASWFAFVDADAIFARTGTPLHRHPDIKAWLSNTSSAIWAERELSGRNRPGSFYEAPNGRNHRGNTYYSSYLLLVKPRATLALSYWFCLSETRCDETKGGAGCYRVDWAHEQKLLDSLPRLGINVGTRATPGAGPEVAHHMFKKDPTAYTFLLNRTREYVARQHAARGTVARPASWGDAVRSHRKALRHRSEGRTKLSASEMTDFARGAQDINRVQRERRRQSRREHMHIPPRG